MEAEKRSTANTDSMTLMPAAVNTKWTTRRLVTMSQAGKACMLLSVWGDSKIANFVAAEHW